MAIRKDTFIEVDAIVFWLMKEGYPLDWQTNYPPHKGIRIELAIAWARAWRHVMGQGEAIKKVYGKGKWSQYLERQGLDPYDEMLEGNTDQQEEA